LNIRASSNKLADPHVSPSYILKPSSRVKQSKNKKKMIQQPIAGQDPDPNPPTKKFNILLLLNIFLDIIVLFLSQHLLVAAV
jgi:hypothetical protein